MTDTRQVLEEAWEHLCQTSLSFRRYACTTIPGGDGWTMTGKFCRFLDAEAWTDAALCLVPEGWRISNLSQHDHPLLRERGEWLCTLYRDGQLGMLDRDTFCVRCNHATTPALAIAQAALRAKEAGDV